MSLPPFNPRRAKAPKSQPGEGDDVPCVKCGAVALDTGLECSECGHDNYEAITGRSFGGNEPGTRLSPATAVPLVEQLRSIPRDAKLRIDTPNALGCMDTHSIPVGRLCHEAADALGVLAAAPALSEAQIQRGLDAYWQCMGGIEPDTTDAIVAAMRAADGVPAAVPNCGSYACKAAQRDSVICAEGECDIASGVRAHGVREDGNAQR